MVELAGRLINFCGGGAAVTEEVQVQDLNDQTIAAETDACGDFYFCVPPGTIVTANIQAPSFIPTIAPPFEAFTNTLQQPVTLFCNSLIAALATDGIDLDTAKAAIGVNVDVYLQTADCPDAGAGWTFELQALDGGLVTAQTVIVAGTDIDPEDTQTGPNGSALLINIDSSWQNVVMTAYFDGGATGCTNGYALPPFYQTGIVPLRAGEVSYELFQPREEGNRTCALSTGTVAPFDPCTSTSDCRPDTVCEGSASNGYFCRPLCLSQTDCIPWLGTYPALVCQPQNCTDGQPASAQVCTDQPPDTLLSGYAGSTCCSG